VRGARPPFDSWEAAHFARTLLAGLDLRVHHDTRAVTFYNAPNADLLRHHHENLPEKLARQHVNPHVPWLYNFQLDFRFK